MRTLLTELRAQLEEVSATLPQVAVRRMFGCDAFFAGGSAKRRSSPRRRSSKPKKGSGVS
jgi:hypothetical protein